MVVAIAILGVCALGIVGLVAFNMVINSKLKKMEQQEVAQKEADLKKKLGKDEAKEEPTEEVKEEPVEEKAEEPIEEAKEEPAEEKVEEPVEEVKEEPVEEKAEEPVEEVKEEPAEEKVEEPTEEVKEEPVEEKAEEPVEEVKEEPKKEKKEKKAKKEKKQKAIPAPVEEVKEENNQEVEKEVEDLLKDVPDADETAAAVAEPVEEVKEEPVEEKAEEPAPVVAPVKAPAKKAKPAGRKPAEKKEKAPAPKKAPGKKATKVEQELADGKWVLIPDSDGYYYGKLHANNGQMILETEKYKGVAGLKSGIETIKKNIEKDNFEISVDKNDTANFKLFGSNMGLLCIGEGYSSKDSALSAIESVKHFFNSIQVVSEEVEEAEVKKYSIDEADKNPNGKWLIVDTEDGYFHAELKANNGQVLLVTENYKGINSLKSGLNSIRSNIATGNFSSKKDKNENYNFKLFAENKRLLALGAGYSSLASCESAIESVMRFCDSPVINADGSADEQ